MKTLLSSLLIAGALVAPAHAAAPVRCFTSVFNVLCLPSQTNHGGKVIHLGDGIRRDDVSDADRTAWAQRCKPSIVSDGTADRWVYAQEGCASGPTAGESNVK